VVKRDLDDKVQYEMRCLHTFRWHQYCRDGVQ